MVAAGSKVLLGAVANLVGLGLVGPSVTVLGAAVLLGAATNLVSLWLLVGSRFHLSISSAGAQGSVP